MLITRTFSPPGPGGRATLAGAHNQYPVLLPAANGCLAGATGYPDYPRQLGTQPATGEPSRTASEPGRRWCSPAGRRGGWGLGL